MGILLNRVRNALDKRWRQLAKNSHVPTYFYALSSHNQGWGVVVPEILGVLKHASVHGYRIQFIAKEGTHTTTIRFFDIGEELAIWDRDQFIFQAGLELYSSILSQRAWNKQEILANFSQNVEIVSLLDQNPNFRWPFSDIFRILVHSTEYVHPAFAQSRSIYSIFESLTVNGMVAGENPISLTSHNKVLARTILGNYVQPRFVLSVREAPLHHGGTGRNTTLEDLDQVLSILCKFTKSIDLIGTSPGKVLSSIIQKYSSHFKIQDFTHGNYETYPIDNLSPKNIESHLLQTYLLSTPNVKLLPQNGIAVIPSATGQMAGIYGTPNIFNAWMKDVLLMPQRFNYAPNKSPVKAFIYGLNCNYGESWAYDRLPCAYGVLQAGIENLLAHHLPGSEYCIRKNAFFDSKLLLATRRSINLVPNIKADFELVDFGTHLIQDSFGNPICYT
ncbi:hypothetical protein [Cyanobium sp. WAJ14-Wanaka]|uniref:hypothetical protein n=1 Tax=Cyanobium sp. WAJ14-Wanaka TaxID=2823725 RepID=UPI0020CF0464|nr:hypothetical protein [Cyanobium sp. WAJ14-Wanaka]MCP9775679.1 hypothetical protein [Cyanobium sp. WAJ14-Wanaka]